MSYLISLDCDSTLLKRNKSISFRTKRYLRKLSKKGHHIVLNTGRPVYGTLKIYKELNILSEPLICNNGAVIAYLDKDFNIKSSTTFPIKKELAHKLFLEVKSIIKGALSSTLVNTFVTNKEYVPSFLFHDNDGMNLVEGEINQTLKEDPLFITFYIECEKEQEFLNILNKEEYKSLHSTCWKGNRKIISYELFDLKASKGKAMLYLADYLNIPVKNIIAIGDQLNDISMIIKAGYGVAMKNAVEELIDVAPLVTKYSNEKNGVYKFLKKELRL